MAQSRSIGIFLFIALIWGSTWIANAMLPEQVGPINSTVSRYLIGVLFLAVAHGCMFLKKRLRPEPASVSTEEAPAPLIAADDRPSFEIQWALDQKPARQGVAPCMVLGFTMFAMPNLLIICAFERGSGAWTPLIYAGLPLGLLLAAREFRSAAIIGLGAMLVLLNGSLPLSAVKLGWASLIVAAVSLQGWSLQYAKRHLAMISTIRGVMIQLMVAAVALQFALQFWPETERHVPRTQWPVSLIEASAFLAILATAVAYPLYYRLLARFEPAQLASCAWLQTVIGVGESAWLLRQRPGLPRIGAACVLVTCTILVMRPADTHPNHDLRLTS